MKLFIDDIKKIEWLSTALEKTDWGKALLGLKKGAFFVVYYNLEVKESRLDIGGYKIVYELNDSIYRGMSEFSRNNLAYIQEPFETSTQLLYLLLRTAVGEIQGKAGLVNLDRIFYEYKVQDIEQSKSRIKINIRGSQDIESRLGFNNALLNIFYFLK